MESFFERLEKKSREIRSQLCVGLDDPNPEGRLERIKNLIEQTEPYVVCYKLNPAFYQGDSEEIKAITSFLNDRGALWIYDGKTGDVPHTNEQYAKFILETLNASALTLNPYLGVHALEPFLRDPSKGAFLLGLTSNSRSDEVQSHDLVNKVGKWCSGNPSQMGMVVAGNKPSPLSDLRGRHPNVWFLSPGIGAQGGAVKPSLRKVLFCTSRSILNAQDPSLEAMKLACSSYFDYAHELTIYGIVKEGDYTLSSGERSNYYVDMRDACSYPGLFKQLCRDLSSVISKENTIVGLATAGIPYATEIASQREVPFGYVRTARKDHGTQSLVEGRVDPYLPITLIDDVITTGSSVVKSVHAMRDLGYNVTEVACIVSRGDRGEEALANLGVRLKSLIKL